MHVCYIYQRLYIQYLVSTELTKRKKKNNKIKQIPVQCFCKMHDLSVPESPNTFWDIVYC